MEKFTVSKYYLLLLLFVAPFTYAENFAQDFCTPSLAGGNLVMRLVPIDPSGAYGILSVFHDSGPTCMTANRDYSIAVNKLAADGIDAVFVNRETLYVSFPQNWVGFWRKSNCSGKPANPCN